MKKSILYLIAFALLLIVPRPSLGQPLSIVSGIQTYSALANTVVTMTGHSELHLTDPNDPMPGCVINLNSSDAWLFLENVRPSSVISTYLAQIKVDGVAALNANNVRVVEYAMGTVVIPQSPAFTPLQVYKGTQFTGNALSLGLYTYYNKTNLGPMYQAISSFKLKRGYMAAFAQQANGTGISRVYIAQDGDLQVSAVPPDLNGSIGFVRVIPWHWTAKKGWGGSPQLLVDPLWSYDWDNVASSSPDVEYVPMRHNKYWNSYSNINSKHGSTAALGFNEPNASDQANMTVAEAIAAWPNLMASGLRLGSPAPTDGGAKWLYDFIDQADALNYRVDYVALHFYRCGQTATQFYNFLKAIHDRTGRPLWVTEFNNGAEWTSCAVPTLAQNAQVMGQWLDMLENTPFIERYAIYNKVGATRAMVSSSGEITPAGVIYRNKASRISYQQELPSGAASEAAYAFEFDALDSTGNGNDGMLVGAPSTTSGISGQALRFDGIHDYVQVPASIGHGTGFTFAAWIKWDGGENGQRIFELGSDASHYIMLSPSSSSKTLRFAITTNGSSGEQRLETTRLALGTWTHVAVTISGTTGKLFINGALVKTGRLTINPSAIGAKYNYLGKSHSSSPLFAGAMDEVYFSGHALTDDQIAAAAGPGITPVPTDGITATVTNHRTSSVDIPLTAAVPDNSPLTYSIAAAPTHGTLSLAGGIVHYTPRGDNVTQDTFTWRASSGGISSRDATVLITYIPGGTIITGKVNLQGRSTSAEPLAFTLTPTGMTMGNVLTQTITPAANGAFIFSGVASGTYALGIKGSIWLRKTVVVNTNAGDVSGITVTLLTGDLNNDNQIDDKDQAILRQAYGSSNGMSGWNASADLNGDGQVSMLDMGMLRSNLGKHGD